MKIQALYFFLFILVSATFSQNTQCPFDYLYHFGDGVTDIGNSIHVLPWGPNLPAAHLPYGITYPGFPTGRWSDGLIDFDFSAIDFGLPHIVPYLSMNTTTNDGVIFSVARSPVLDFAFFESNGIEIPPFAVPLSGQISWFRTYLQSVCSTPTDCANWLRNSLILMGDIEGNDIGYSLTQNKTIEEVQTYVPYIIATLVNATRELINMGATRVIIPGNGPIGCYPYILTELSTNDSTAYDEIGCLRSVNDLIQSKNADLRQAIENLHNEFPNIIIYYGNMYDGILSIINETLSGPNGKHALKACCGIGGVYNFDRNRFCGSLDVPVCSNPNEYLFWDGLHYTQEAYHRMEQLLIQEALASLNCTTQLSASM